MCTVLKRDGKVCGSWCDKRVSEVCEYHVQNAVERRRAGRAEFSIGFVLHFWFICRMTLNLLLLVGHQGCQQVQLRNESQRTIPLANGDSSLLNLQKEQILHMSFQDMS